MSPTGPAPSDYFNQGGITLPPVIIHIIAAQSETGKTTVMEKVIPSLKKRGVKLAALKGNLSHYDLDLPGKDSWRFGEAGADISGLATKESFFITGSDKSSSGLEAAADLLSDFDLLLVEGDKKTKNPKVEVIRSAINPQPLLFENTIALVGDCLETDANIPLFSFEEIEELADFIAGFLNKKEPEVDSSAHDSFTHLDSKGRPRMVDVSGKNQTLREAYARGEIIMSAETLAKIKSGSMSKGDVLAVAQVAAVMGVKETGRLIPMAHPLGISGVEVDFTPVEQPVPKVEIGVRVKLTGQTGVEMEALTGVSLAALTIYDMCKAVDKDMVIRNIRLVEKKGGRSGHYQREHS
jgi:cyclic pyranopterin phosphate synthase